MESTYDSLYDKSQLAAGRVAIRESEDNKMAAVIRINALNKSISANKELKTENIYLKIEVNKFKTKYGELDGNGLKRLDQKKNELQIHNLSSTSNTQELLQCYKNQA